MQRPSHIPTQRETARNVIAIWANRALSAVAPLVLTPLIVHRLGLQRMGVWLLATQFAAHLMLFDAGLANSLVRFLARARALNDRQQGSQFLSTALVVLGGLSTALLLSAFALAALFVRVFPPTPDLRAMSYQLAFATVLYVALSLPLRVGYGLLSSCHRFDLIQLWEGTGTLIRVTLVFASFTWLDPTPVHLAAIVFGCSLLSVGMIFYKGLRLNPQLELRVRDFSRASCHALVSMGAAAMLVTLGGVLLTQGPSMLAGSALGPASVAIIAVPLMIFTSIWPFFNTFALIAAPVAAGLAAQRKQDALLAVLLVGARYLSTSALITAVGAWLFSERVFGLWLSGPALTSQDLHRMAWCLQTILWGFALSALAPLGRSVLASVGHHWSSAWAEVLSAAAGIGLAAVLMYGFNWSADATALGVALALIARGVVLMPILLARFFEIKVWIVLRHSLAIPLLAGIGSVTVSAIVHYAAAGVLARSWTREALSVVIGALVWGWCIWKWILTTEHREALKGRLKKIPGANRYLGN